jgi:hypothetical protein
MNRAGQPESIDICLMFGEINSSAQDIQHQRLYTSRFQQGQLLQQVTQSLALAQGADKQQSLQGFILSCKNILLYTLHDK